MAMDVLEICARMTSACPWPEGAEEQPALTESGSRIVSACASVAYSLLTEAERQRPTIDREALAAALHDAYVADATIVWGERCEDVRQGYRREADTAIRLCAGADAGARIADLETQIQRLQDRLTSAENGREDFRKAYNAAIDDGNASVRRLTATANAAVERAEAAEAAASADARLARDVESEALENGARHRELLDRIEAAMDYHYTWGDYGDGLIAHIKQIMADRNAAITRAEKAEADCRNIADPLARLQARAEEAEVRAAKAEKALRLSADAAEAATTDEEDARQELYDARAENDRLRRAISVALIGAKHMATVAALLTGEADDA